MASSVPVFLKISALTMEEEGKVLIQPLDYSVLNLNMQRFPERFIKLGVLKW